VDRTSITRGTIISGFPGTVTLSLKYTDTSAFCKRGVRESNWHGLARVFIFIFIFIFKGGRRGPNTPAFKTASRNSIHSYFHGKKKRLISILVMFVSKSSIVLLYWDHRHFSPVVDKLSLSSPLALAHLSDSALFAPGKLLASEVLLTRQTGAQGTERSGKKKIS